MFGKKIFFSFLCFFSPIFSAPSYTTISDEAELPLLNPSLKNRQTAKIRLENGLHVYLISDKEADQSAAALGVKAGSWDNPKQFPGTAHFLEHMLFMGTEKYPDENAFHRWIADHGGKTNAFTASDRTVYFFSINHEAFDQVLDFFAHFFIDPLFNPSGMGREMHAVDQEHAKNIENDSWRRYMISKELGNPNHPNVEFSTGNSQTLSHIPQSVMKKWYQEHYSANIMSLVIYSSKPLDELITLTTSLFSQIPNSGVTPLSINAPLQDEKNLGHLVYIEPIKNLQTIALTWELPTSFINDETKSADLLAYAFNRGQKNSLLEILKKERLAENLRASVERIGDHFIGFEIEINLTDKGLEKRFLVIQRCFEALERLRSTPTPPYLFREMVTMRKINYQYQARVSAFDFIMNHGTSLLDEPLSSYPKKSLLPTEYSPEKLTALLDYLRPKRCEYYITADPQKTKIFPDRQEKWLGGRYHVQKISDKLLASWSSVSAHPHIHIAKPNLFLPSKLQLLPKTAQTAPIKMIDNEDGKVFYWKDNLYETPEVVYSLYIKSPLLDGSVRAQTLMDLYTDFIEEKLAPTLSCASYAGIRTRFSYDRNSLAITLSGFSDKASFLLEEILKELKQITPTREDFEVYYQSLSKAYQNAGKELPFRQAAGILFSILKDNSSTAEEKGKELKMISFSDFLDFHSKLFEKTYVEALFAGNLTIKQAESSWLDIKHILSRSSFPKEFHPRSRVLCLPNKGPFFIEKPTPMQGNGVILAIDQGTFSFEEKASQKILSLALQEAFFTTLRTKQKTGYIAHSFPQEIENKLFQYFMVQSNSHKPLDLLYRFELFLETFLQEMETELPLARFEKIRDSYITSLHTQLRNLQERAYYYEYIAFQKEEDFDYLEKVAATAKSLSYDRFCNYAKRTLSRTNKKRLAVSVTGKLAEEQEFAYKDIPQAEIFKQGKYISSAQNEKSSP